MSQYPELSYEYETTQNTLRELGIDVYEPQSRFEVAIAQSLGEFSTFVLHRGKEKCLEIIENDLYNNDNSVGELQGGDDSYSIYRVSFPEGDEYSSRARKGKNAAAKLLQEFNDFIHQNKRNSNTMPTFDNIKQYMLSMCNRRSRERHEVEYSSLGNLMFILCFGESGGQVRHIDNMVPNLQICLYISQSCPSTVVYEMDDLDGPSVTDAASLLDLWSRQHKTIPSMIVDTLMKHGDTSLKRKRHTKYFGFWKSINAHLLCFGKLYQPVCNQLSFEADPGTVLLAGGNEIHAGPSTTGPRMFIFAVGIPDAGLDERVDSDNDGEIQYSPVLLHIDLCCILFSLLDYDGDTSSDATIIEAKEFLVNILVELLNDYPMKEYLRQISEDRKGTRSWLEKVLYLMDQSLSVDSLIEDAIHSGHIFYSPDVVNFNSKKKKKRRQRTKPDNI